MTAFSCPHIFFLSSFCVAGTLFTTCIACFATDVTVVHVSEVYRHSPPGISAVGKDASAVTKDHVTPLSRCQGNNACLSNKTITTAAVEPVIGCKDLANQRSLSDKLDLVVTSAGTYVHTVYPSWM